MQSFFSARQGKGDDQLAFCAQAAKRWMNTLLWRRLSTPDASFSRSVGTFALATSCTRLR